MLANSRRLQTQNSGRFGGLRSPMAVCLLALPLSAGAQLLPNAPSAVLAQAQVPAQPPAEPQVPAKASPLPELSTTMRRAWRSQPPPCPTTKPAGSPPAGAPVVAQAQNDQPCVEEDPIQPIIASKNVPPLTPRQKGYLAARDVIDPFNLITILGYSGVVIASNAHTAYGPGWKGFGRLTGYSLVEDMQGEFVGTFMIPSLAHEDPRYYRMPGRPFRTRLFHALTHTVVTRHDDGSPMLNYATLLTYPISAELTNLYVPGVHTNSKSTAQRIGLGLATDPVNQIVAEFLPDVAKRIHIRIIFVQQILQRVAQDGTNGPVMTQ